MSGSRGFNNGGFRKQKWQNRGNRGGGPGGGGSNNPAQPGGMTASGGYAPPKRGGGPKHCPMCGIVAGNLAQHMVQAHDHPVEV